MNIKRFFDLFLCVIALIIFLIPIILISIGIKMTSKGPIIFWSDRIGKCNVIFSMPKFRTMHTGTPQVATNLLKNPSSHLTRFGSFLRKSSLDEIPQLWSIFRGHMSFVGPRPALFNQKNLINMRKKYAIDKINPGLTGWAQINGRDEISISEKVSLDLEYLQKKSFYLDVKILLITLIRVIRRDKVLH